ncbi:DUF2617 family protein [Arthrobacter sp. G119Y2]|uniref:DUF2617 family protein n=1 Tax=Arthrobacter sp. G119Y2 TaxID=3134965 RepID=UPI00311A688E
MLSTSPEPFADTTPADLSHDLRREHLHALASKRIGDLEIRVLGASHQIALGDWTETVACNPNRPAGNLPRTTSEPGYTFTSRTKDYSRRALKEQVQALIAATERHPGGLAVAFAGDPLAVTAITAEVTNEIARWKTWHVYPNTGEIVATQSTLDLSTDQEK